MKKKKDVVKDMKPFEASADASYMEGICKDKLSVTLFIEGDKIKKTGAKLAPSSCDRVKQAWKSLEPKVTGKHIGDAYKISSDDLGDDLGHGASLAVHALRQAILSYESDKATSSLRNALDILQSYDADLPSRDVSRDYEY